MVTRSFPTKENDSAFAYFCLALYMALVLIRPHEIFAISREWILIKIVTIVCIIVTFVAHRPLKPTPQVWLLVALFPVILLSAFLNGYGMKGIEQSQLFLVGSLFPLFLTSTLVTSIKKHHIIMFISLIAALLMVHNGHVQVNNIDGLGWSGTTYNQERIRYLGFFHDPNDIGMFLIMNMPIAAYFFTQSKAMGKIFYFCSFIALLYGVYLTGSRGSILGTVGLVGVFLLVAKGGTKVLLFSVVVAPIAGTMIAAKGGMSSSNASANGRLEAWYSGLHEMFLSNPLFGIGKGNFVDWHGRTAHNSYIMVTGELGFLGYSLWAGALFMTILSGYYLVQKKKKLDMEKSKNVNQKKQNHPQQTYSLLEQELKLAACLFYSMVGYLLTAFFLSRSYTLLLFIFLGLNMASHSRLYKLDDDFKSKITMKYIAKSIIAGWLMVVLVYIALKVAL